MTRLGTRQHPAIVRVQTTERAQQIMTLCNEHGVVCIAGIEPDQPEDIADVDRALNPPTPIRAAPKPGRNDPCPCGSGIKTKRCCPELVA